MGHSRPIWPVGAMSALPPKADSRRTSLEVRFVPFSEVGVADGHFPPYTKADITR
jgi:hypothetical protein